MFLVLRGQIPSKKNSKRIVRAGNRPMLIGSQAYLNWKEAAGWEVYSQLGKQKDFTGTMEGPLSIVMEFWAPDKRRADLSNKWESIGDLLVDECIIEDDSMDILSDLRLRFMGVDKADPRAEITITPVQ